LEQQGLIQAFEFTHELAWNVLNDYLRDQGFVDLKGPKDATRTAFKNGLIDDGDTWMAMIASRNQTSHTYNDDLADEITTLILTRYVPAYEIFDRQFTDIEKEQR
jgi:nucleotidyltransferase substrate binding protein (TIGR01987 family)